MEYHRTFCALCNCFSVHCAEIGGEMECIHHRTGKTCHNCGINIMDKPRYQFGKLSYCVTCHDEGFGKIVHVVVDGNWPKTA